MARGIRGGGKEDGTYQYQRLQRGSQWGLAAASIRFRDYPSDGKVPAKMGAGGTAYQGLE